MNLIPSTTRRSVALALGSLVLTLGLSTSPAAFAAKDVTFAVSLNLETLDPYNTNSTLNQAAGKTYYEGLYEFDQELKLVPKLATAYDVTPDGLVYTFKLRAGIKFHDGTDFAADSVKASLDRVANPDNKLARYSQFNRIAKTEVIDAQTVRVTLKEPFSAFINALAHPTAMIISSAALTKYGKDIGLNPVGTGPFKFVEWKPPSI